MINNLLAGGVFLTLIAAVWEKIKKILWYFGSLFLVKIEVTTSMIDFKYYWNHLKNHKFLVPVYTEACKGSGAESKRLHLCIGAKHYKLMKVGKRYVLARMTEKYTLVILSLKFYVSYEEIHKALSNYYSQTKKDEKKNKSKRFTTNFVRGGINNVSLGNPSGGDTSCDEATSKAWLDCCEAYNFGSRINYTKKEYNSLITFHNENSTLFDYLYVTEEMKQLKHKIDLWFKNKDWFLDRGIQWKRGALLYGPPGTGKTSFVAALAEHFNVPLYVFDLSTFTNNDLESEWNHLKSSTPCFVLFEDFDSVFDKRKHTVDHSNMMAKPVSFDCVLNILDGAVKYDGIVTFITTNEIEKIDPALGGGKNPKTGRVDYVCEFNGLDEEGKRFIAESIVYGIENEEEIREDLINSSKDFTPAQFKDLCIEKALELYDSNLIQGEFTSSTNKKLEEA